MKREEQRRYLDALGIPLWVLRSPAAAEAAPAATAEPVPEAVSEAVPEPAPQALEHRARAWRRLEQQVTQCTACELARGRTRTVFGVGNHDAELLVIGEAPGAEEDRQGLPFVGRAGRLLDAMLLAIGYRREEVYIANIVKCRPPGNRDPRPEEAAACAGYLAQQIALLQPAAILALGRVAAQNLLHSDARIGALRGRVHHHGEAAIPLVATYHPAYLLRSPQEKRKAWHDLQLLQRTLHAAEEG